MLFVCKELDQRRDISTSGVFEHEYGHWKRCSWSFNGHTACIAPGMFLILHDCSADVNFQQYCNTLSCASHMAVPKE